MTEKKVFIIIVNFNGWPDTLECLASLEKIDYQNFEVILIDNGSKGNFQFPTLPTGRQVSNFQLKINFIQNKENLGFAAGNNQGIKIALEQNADYVLFLNNDTAVEPDFLKKLVEMAEKDKKTGIAGPMIYYYDDRQLAIGDRRIQFAGGKINWLKTKGKHQIDYRLPTTDYRLQPKKPGGGRWTVDGGYQTDYITGCCLLIKREVIEKIGLLSEDYFLYYEDADWCLRAKKAGFECVLAREAKIYHKQSASTGEFSYPYIYYHSRNGLLCGWKNGPKIFVLIQSIWIFFKQAVKMAVGCRRAWARPVMKGVVDFWRGKRGKLKGYY